ncbi:DUF3048 domain-containing protein [bacterium]|nr:DUF3048 domain-containing protein [bacterium]
MARQKFHTKHQVHLDTASNETASRVPNPMKISATYAKPWYKTRRGIIGIISATVILLGGGVGAWYVLAQKKPTDITTSQPTASPSPEPTPILKEAPLTGTLIDPALITRPVIGVVIENLDPNARPQSGLSQAGVVYEALAEGGITRYVAFYQTDLPTDIGPVRSLRPVFYQMGMEYGAPVAHVGGSTDGLALARSGSGFKDLDQFFNANYFRRINTRYAPHNVYIYGESLTKLVADKGWATPPTFTPWKRKDDAPSNQANATKIVADFSSPGYIATFQYDSSSNSYVRSIGGVPDLDAANSKKQINPKTVIIIYAQTSYGTQPNGKPKTDIDLIGTGKAVLFQDGTATECRWQKTSDAGRLTLLDTSGQELSLNRGQSWVSILPTGRAASWQ